MPDDQGARGEAHDGDDEQQDHARGSRDTGGDAPAAASIEEREAVAADDDDLMGDDDT